MPATANASFRDVIRLRDIPCAAASRVPDRARAWSVVANDHERSQGHQDEQRHLSADVAWREILPDEWREIACADQRNEKNEERLAAADSLEHGHRNHRQCIKS